MEDRLLKNRLGYFLLFMVSILYIGCYYPCFYNQFLLSEGFIGPKNCIFLSVIWAFFLFVFRKNKKICYPSPRFNKALVCLFFYLLFRVLFFNEESSISYINTIFVSWLLVFLDAVIEAREGEEGLALRRQMEAQMNAETATEEVAEDAE